MSDNKLRYTVSQINLFLANITDPDERELKKDILRYFESTQNLGGFIAWFMHPSIKVTCDKSVLYVLSDWGVMMIKQRYLNVLQKFNIFIEKKLR